MNLSSRPRPGRRARSVLALLGALTVLQAGTVLATGTADGTTDRRVTAVSTETATGPTSSDADPSDPADSTSAHTRCWAAVSNGIVHIVAQYAFNPTTWTVFENSATIGNLDAASTFTGPASGLHPSLNRYSIQGVTGDPVVCQAGAGDPPNVACTFTIEGDGSITVTIVSPTNLGPSVAVPVWNKTLTGWMKAGVIQGALSINMRPLESTHSWYIELAGVRYACTQTFPVLKCSATVSDLGVISVVATFGKFAGSKPSSLLLSEQTGDSRTILPLSAPVALGSVAPDVVVTDTDHRYDALLWWKNLVVYTFASHDGTYVAKCQVLQKFVVYCTATAVGERPDGSGLEVLVEMNPLLQQPAAGIAFPFGLTAEDSLFWPNIKVLDSGTLPISSLSYTDVTASSVTYYRLKGSFAMDNMWPVQLTGQTIADGFCGRIQR